MIPSRYIPHEPFSFNVSLPYVNPIDSVTKRAGTQSAYFSTNTSISTGLWGNKPLSDFTPSNYEPTNISPEVCWRENPTEHTSPTKHYTPDFYYTSTPTASGFNFDPPNTVLRATSPTEWAAYLSPNTPGPQLCADMKVGCCTAASKDNEYLPSSFISPSSAGYVCFSNGSSQDSFCATTIPSSNAPSAIRAPLACPFPDVASVVDRYPPYFPTFVKMTDTARQVRLDSFVYGTSSLMETLQEKTRSSKGLWRPLLPIGRCWFGIPYTWGREPSELFVILLGEGLPNATVRVLYDGPLHATLAASFMEVYHVDSATSIRKTLIGVLPKSYIDFTLPPLPINIVSIL